MALERLNSGIEPTLIVVLSDINMPGMDGLQLLGEIEHPVLANVLAIWERPNSSRSRSTSMPLEPSYGSSPPLRIEKDDPCGRTASLRLLALRVSFGD